MFSDSPFRWINPTQWPWMVWVWLAMTAASQVRPFWQWFQQHRSQGWPTAPGRIDQARVEPKSQSFFSSMSRRGTSNYNVQIAFSYVIGGDTYPGCWKKEFADEREALEFVRGLFGQPVLVSYNPRRTSDSTLQEEAIKKLQEARSPGGIRPRMTDVPAWVKPLLWPFVVLSAVGFGLSLWVHFGALAGRTLAPGTLFWLLHVGVFVVWFPALVVSNRRVGNIRRKDFWYVVFRGSPAWVKYAVYAFLGYAMVNSLISFSQAPSQAGFIGAETSVTMSRTFSAGWMAFYFCALAILYSAVRSLNEASIDTSYSSPSSGKM